MNKFKEGDYILTASVPDETTFRAIMATSCIEDRNNEREMYLTNYDLGIMFWHERETLQCGLGKNSHTLGEWLFKNAPDWAVDLVLAQNDRYAWRGALGKYSYTDDSGYLEGMPASVLYGDIIAVRKPLNETGEDVNIEIKQATIMYATNVKVACPHCTKMQEGFIGNPAGGIFVCEDCGKPFKVHPDADIEFIY